MTTPPLCPFCEPEDDRVFLRDALVVGLWDRYPVSPGHALLVTRRHVADWFDATGDEHRSLIVGLERARATIEATHQPAGYNIGVNIGVAGGQTIGHLHIHLIPRYPGDVPDPRGGVRNVIPHRAPYPFSAPHVHPLVAGDEDPLLPHLVALIAEASEVDINVAFVMNSGLDMLLPHLQDMLRQGGRLRLLTGDYLNATDPIALRRLLDLRAAIGPERVTLRIFETQGTAFHPKAYIIHDRHGATAAFVGSSNLSSTALAKGVEWNYRIVTPRDTAGVSAVVERFERLFAHPHTRTLTQEWVEEYGRRRGTAPPPADSGTPDEPPTIPSPHQIQRNALQALEATRAAGAKAGLVVLATGLGKTWLSAFDTSRPEFTRVLFVAHREEILGQAMATFRRVRPTVNLGLYTGAERQPDADVLFASVQTLGRAAHLLRFDRRRFDYIVIDEFHHAAAATYRRIIDHFEPKFLLGLTATPERTDGGDLLALCGENLVYRCDLLEGIRAGLLAPFDYYGVPDDVDYRNIPWRSSRFDENELTNAVTTERRAANALDQLRRRGGERVIAFCVSQRHADYMAEYLVSQGLRAVAVHSGATTAPRALSLERLDAGDLDVLCAVDMFNEGVDLPHVDTILMLRPTESRIVWLQQFGRGLRYLRDKRLKVIDYIGNHRSFLLKPRTLLGLPTGDGEIRAALEMLEQGTFELPEGCSVTYDLEAKQIIRALLRGQPADQLKAYYTDFEQDEGVRPTAAEAYHDGFDPGLARPSYGSWLSFVRAMGGLEGSALDAFEAHKAMLDAFEVTDMTKSYKMLVLGALLAEGALEKGMALPELASAVRRFASRFPGLADELASAAPDENTLQALLEANPIKAWVAGKGTGGTSYFRYGERRFALGVAVEPAHAQALVDLVREIADWRLASYERRISMEMRATRFEGTVVRSGADPFVRLPSRASVTGMPEGTTELLVEGRPYRGFFLRESLNLITAAGAEDNALPGLLRQWFGAEAGFPGRKHHVLFERREAAYELSPLKAAHGVATFGEAYARDQIPPLFGAPFTSAQRQVGVIHLPVPKRLLLLVTLDKQGMQQAHRYQDKFDSRTVFKWQSQNRTGPEGKIGQIISKHRDMGYQVHLFVRRTASHDGRAAPFVYCGELDFQESHGERPMNVIWRLHTPLDDETARKLGVD